MSGSAIATAVPAPAPGASESGGRGDHATESVPAEPAGRLR